LSFSCSYPTYEEWKQNNIISIFYYCFRFLSYLWGMETNRPLDCSIEGLSSFLSYLWGMETTFPSYITDSLNRSYPTYEEWKLLLSMRRLLLLLLFLSYLWGMETEWPSKILLSLNLVLILPMRNGNCTLMLPFTFSVYVLILPMRNGNLLTTKTGTNLLSCSYPTYEEWKLLYHSQLFSTHVCSYPTYEEWKHLYTPS